MTSLQPDLRLACSLSDASICEVATTLRGGNRRLLRTGSGAAGPDLRPYTESLLHAVSHLVNAPYMTSQPQSSDGFDSMHTPWAVLRINHEDCQDTLAQDMLFAPAQALPPLICGRLTHLGLGLTTHGYPWVVKEFVGNHFKP